MAETEHKHEFGDGCPANLDISTPKGLAKFGLIYLLTRYPLKCNLYRIGFSKILVPFAAISAQKKVREYIQTTPEQTALSEYQSPGIFDSNKFPPDTIIKLTPAYRAKASRFDNDETKVPLYDRATKTISEVPRGWVETELPIMNSLAKLPTSYLGVVRRLPGVSDNIIIYFDNHQQDIMSRLVEPYVGTSAIALGRETHMGFIGQFGNKIGFRIDLIASMEKAEIMAMGKPVKETSKVPAERNISLAKAYSLFPS